MINFNKTYILYHSQCFDGFGAAFAAWYKLQDSAEYIPVSYGNPIPKMKDNSIVYILDFCYDYKELKELASRMLSVTILDHHISAMNKIIQNTTKNYDTNNGFFNITENNLYINFDMSRSGAGMSWDHFHPDSERPSLIDLLEDRDLWKFKFGNISKWMHSYLLSIPMNFNEYLKLIQTTEAINKAITTGEALHRMTEQIVKNICKNSWIGQFQGHKVAMVNASSHWSEVGEQLLNDNIDVEFAVSYTDLPNEIRMFSIRSKGDMDVSLIAQKLGGGGHKNASGAKVNNKKIIILELEEVLKKYYDNKKDNKSLTTAQVNEVTIKEFLKFYMEN
jgi:oligoribonuclease NrnB/cAMP/cGMP phosphodiesterase (DHH superfamily)